MFTHLMKTYQGRNVMSIKFCISAKNLSRLLTTPAGYSEFEQAGMMTSSSWTMM